MSSKHSHVMHCLPVGNQCSHAPILNLSLTQSPDSYIGPACHLSLTYSFQVSKLFQSAAFHQIHHFTTTHTNKISPTQFGNLWAPARLDWHAGSPTEATERWSPPNAERGGTLVFMQFWLPVFWDTVFSWPSFGVFPDGDALLLFEMMILGFGDEIKKLLIGFWKKISPRLKAQILGQEKIISVWEDGCAVLVHFYLFSAFLNPL